jgi:hypothetical protein
MNKKGLNSEKKKLRRAEIGRKTSIFHGQDT